MVRNGIFRKKGLKLAVILSVALFMLGMNIAGAAPQMIIECKEGCKNIDFDKYSGNYTIWVSQNKVTLRMTDLTSDTGQTFIWMQNGDVVGRETTYSFIAAESTKLMAAVTSRGLFDRKYINVILVVPVIEKSLPSWGSPPISVDSVLHKANFVGGDNFTVTVNIYGGKRYLVTLKALKNGVETKDIIFKDNHKPVTTATVRYGATPDRVTIKAILSLLDDPKGPTSESDADIFIVAKEPMSKIEIDSDPVKGSFNDFSAGISKNTNENNVFINNCSVVLRNEPTKDAQGAILPGKIIDRRSVISDRGAPLRRVILSPQDPGIYTIEADCRDSYGTALYANETVSVALGKTGKEKPHTIVEKTVNCFVGAECPIYFNKTNDFGVDLYGEYIILTDVPKQNIGKLPVHPCDNDRKCPTKFESAGNQSVKLRVQYKWLDQNNRLRYSQASEETILVKVSPMDPGTENRKTAVDYAWQAAQPAATPGQYGAPIPGATITAAPSKDISAAEDSSRGFPVTEVVLGIIVLVMLAILVWVIKNKIKERKETKEMQENTSFSRRRKYLKEKP